MKNLLQIKHIPNSHLVVPSSRNSTIGSKASQNQLIYAGQFLVTDQKDLQLSPLKLYSINVDVSGKFETFFFGSKFLEAKNVFCLRISEKIDQTISY